MKDWFKIKSEFSIIWMRDFFMVFSFKKFENKKDAVSQHEMVAQRSYAFQRKWVIASFCIKKLRFFLGIL